MECGQLTKTLALEWAPKQIRVNALAPGYVLTDLVGHLFLEDPKQGMHSDLSAMGKEFVHVDATERRHFLSDVAGCEHLHSSPLQAAVFSLSLLASPTSADHFTVFEVHAGVFDCATNRRRVIIVGFSDHTHLAKFGNGPKPWTEKPRPIKGIVRCPRFSSYRLLTSLTSLTSLPLPSSSPPLFPDSPCLQ